MKTRIGEADSGEKFTSTVDKELPEERLGRTNKGGYQYFFDLENDQDFKAEIEVVTVLNGGDIQSGLLDLYSEYMFYTDDIDFCDWYVLEKKNYCFNFLDYKFDDITLKAYERSADWNEYYTSRNLANFANFSSKQIEKYCF